jgi:hypothetical protein
LARAPSKRTLVAKRQWNILMSEKITQIDTDPSSNGHVLADLERRVQILESRIALLPDSRQIEERVTERVKASMPPPAPPVNPAKAPGFKDIEMPIPSVQTVVNTAKATWLIFEMLAELRMLFWTLFDRRYHVAWITRFITIGLVILILTSQWWVPLAKVDYIGGVLDKIADLLLGLIMFTVLSFETRRYKEWRGGQRL